MKKIILAAICLALIPMATMAQKKVKSEKEAPKKGYVFTDVKVNQATSVKNQASSGTCWSFSGLATVESELIKRGKGEYDLSEMWIVRHTYFDKAVKYARMHGAIGLSAGGATHDVFNVIDRYGIVPEEAYKGLNYGTDKHLHGELDCTIKAYMDAIISNPNKSLSTAWQAGLNGILDAYLGAVPEKFTYKGKEYTPKTFVAELDLKGSDFQSYTSFTHHPFGEEFAIEVPDNWAWGSSKNVPLDELISIIDKALENGSSVLWATDVSERGFQYNKGFAVMPEINVNEMSDSEKAKWSTLTDKERNAELFKFETIVPEIIVTQESRQKGFDNYQTTDDHGMEIVGWATDQNGNKYYKVKNSWSGDGVYGGYFYASVPFVKAKTMNIVVPK